MQTFTKILDFWLFYDRKVSIQQNNITQYKTNKTKTNIELIHVEAQWRDYWERSKQNLHVQQYLLCQNTPSGKEEKTHSHGFALKQERHVWTWWLGQMKLWHCWHLVFDFRSFWRGQSLHRPCLGPGAAFSERLEAGASSNPRRSIALFTDWRRAGSWLRFFTSGIHSS